MVKNLKKKVNSKKVKKAPKKPSFTPQDFPEIFIGLVGPLGVDLKLVGDELSDALIEVGYKPEIIKLSSILNEPTVSKIHKVKLKEAPEDERIRLYMDAGNNLRKKLKANDALALFSVNQIRKIRKSANGDADIFIPKKAYILHSFKNKDEIETLRNIYGPSFFVVSVYSSREKRKNNLSKRIEKSKGKSKDHDCNAIAEKLIDADYNEEHDKHGQDVKSAFPLSDLFISVEDTRPQLKASITRFVHALFGYPYHTPTKNEFGMFLAFSAALRSADLSRQVGSAVLNDDGDLLAIGCNEVPKFGGGQYWEDDEGNKARDFEVGYDSSAKMKKELLEETLRIMKTDGVIAKNRDVPTLTDELLSGSLKDADISNLLEFGRMIHAEMAAISDAAKRGISLKGATLFCTTFPCHMCARHIISAGIKRVIYVEPYPKSKAQELHHDSIVVDSSDQIESKVGFLPFVGIAPYRFHDFFRHGKIKNKDGTRLKWRTNDDAESRPKIKVYNSMSYITHEKDVLKLISEIILRSK